MTFISLFLLFFFFLLFLFLFGRIHWPSYMGNTSYYGSSTGLRQTLQGAKRYKISQPIGTIWCAVCELAKGGMFRVEYAETSIDQKLNHVWNCSSIKVTNRALILQLRARVETQNVGTKVICKSVVNCK